MSTETPTSGLDRLAELTANLQKHIDARAQELAAGIIAAAEQVALEKVANAWAETQRKGELVDELRRQAAVRDRVVDKYHVQERNLAPLLIRLGQVRRTWPNLVDMEPGDAWREIQEIMSLVPQEEL